MISEGLGTREIADKMGYSERTVKNMLHDITSRLHLRNRCHAAPTGCGQA
ncbi:helix-turn-helix domain-containing protein [Kribbella sp. CA-294648]